MPGGSGYEKLAVVVRATRRIAVAIAGTVVIGAGVALLVLPGPAFVVIPMGLAILGLEFAWARRWLVEVREHGQRALKNWRSTPGGGS